MQELEAVGAANVAETAAELMRQHAGFTIVERDNVRFAVVPDGKVLQSLEPFHNETAAYPRRQKGWANVHTIEALIDTTNRFAEPTATTVYVNVDGKGVGNVTAYFNHASDVIPGFADHGSVFVLKQSEPLGAWLSAGARWMKQAEFAAFIEDRMMDLVSIEPGNSLKHIEQKLFTTFAEPAQLMLASRGLSIRIEQEVTNAVTTETGEVTIAFAEKHAKQAGSVDVPKLFAIQCPVWELGASYQIPIKLRYRVSGGTVEWQVQPIMLDKIIEHATAALYDTVKAGVELAGVTVVRGKLVG